MNFGASRLSAATLAVFLLICAILGFAFGQAFVAERSAVREVRSLPPVKVSTSAAVNIRTDAGPSRFTFWPQRPHAIQLHRREVLVSRDVPPGVQANDARTWLIQFGGPIDTAARERLTRLGIELLLPSAAMAWHARATVANLQHAACMFEPELLGWAALDPQDKLRPGVRALKSPSALRLELYPGIDVASLRRQLEKLAEITSVGDGFFEIRTAATDDTLLERVAALDGVYAVGLPRPEKRVLNASASTNSNITPCRGVPRNLSGTGVNVLVRDEGRTFAHPDFGARVTLGPDVALLSPVQHATHVAGTIGGSGSLNALACGMAPACGVVVLDLNGDDFNEPLSGKTTYNAILSNHSYGFITGWEGATFTDNQITFGQYDSFARNWDVLVRAENLIMVKAVGNDRNDSGAGFPHDGTLGSDGEYYDCIEASSTGKNILTVGSATDAAQAGTISTSTMVLPGSGAGPCDDGRVHPELIANGDSVFSCNNSALPGSEYATLDGTSMAAAVVTGATALFIERYQQRFGAGTFPSPHYLRAAYAQTATDMGRPGPDYLHGFGMLDLDAAIDLFEADNGSGTRLQNNSVSAAVPERFFALTSDGVTPIQATLCWTDEPGDLLTARALINDLDLRLIRVTDQSETLPYVLNPANPAQAAFNAPNRADTIEQVRLIAPTAGQYLLAVRGTALATSANFTLASSHALVENLAPVAKLTPSTTSGSPPLLITFSGSASSDPDGFISQYIWDFGDGTSTSGENVSHIYAAGSFTVRLKVIDSGGASAEATTSLGIANRPPIALASATPDAGLPPLALLFSSAGSADPDGTITSFLWDFGDGTTGNGANIAHTYPAPGFYFATLTVTDNGGATAKTNISVLAGKTFTPTSSRFGLNFKRIASDKFSLMTRTLPVEPALNPAGLSGTIEIGSLEYRFTLDEKGRYRLAPLSIQFNPSKTMLRVTISKTNLIPSLASFGARNDDIKNASLRIPFAITFEDGNVFGFTGLLYTYNARRGTSGSASFRP
ncbi:MAG TPA: PKD domain-containing protein [Planctomycetota bacterium]|nr:PKD domain-containing protein [Planctomycetota bacterium]